jgi:hypothetical protein
MWQKLIGREYVILHYMNNCCIYVKCLLLHLHMEIIQTWISKDLHVMNISSVRNIDMKLGV